MLDITKWIDVQVQEQSSIIDSRTDVTPCSTTDTKQSPEQCTEHTVPLNYNFIFTHMVPWSISRVNCQNLPWNLYFHET